MISGFDPQPSNLRCCFCLPPEVCFNTGSDFSKSDFVCYSLTHCEGTKNQTPSSYSNKKHAGLTTTRRSRITCNEFAARGRQIRCEGRLPVMTPEGHRAGVLDKIPNRIRSILLGGRGAVVQAGSGWDVCWVLGGGDLNACASMEQLGGCGNVSQLRDPGVGGCLPWFEHVAAVDQLYQKVTEGGLFSVEVAPES